MSAADLERLQQLEAQRTDLWQVVDEIRAKNEDKNPDEVECDIAEAIATTRREARKRRTTPPTP